VALSKNPKWQRQAEEYFIKAIGIDPYTAENYAQLGQLYRKAGLITRAVKRFDEALKWDAGNKTALDGMQAIQASKTQGISKTLRSFFDKKKE